MLEKDGDKTGDKTSGDAGSRETDCGTEGWALEISISGVGEKMEFRLSNGRRLYGFAEFGEGDWISDIERESRDKGSGSGSAAAVAAG